MTKHKFKILFLMLFTLNLFCEEEKKAIDVVGNQILKYLESKKESALEKREISNKDQKQLDKLIQKIVARSLYERKKAVSTKEVSQSKSAYLGRGVYRVYGTSFGKPGNKGESNVFKDGSKVKWGIVTGALPHPSAVGRTIAVRRTLKDGKKTRWVKVYLRDLGPWFLDDPYWETNSVPRAVNYHRYKKKRWDGRVVMNPAGIDLTPWVWQKLGISAKRSMLYSGYVEWKFID